MMSPLINPPWQYLLQRGRVLFVMWKECQDWERRRWRLRGPRPPSPLQPPRVSRSVESGLSSTRWSYLCLAMMSSFLITRVRGHLERKEGGSIADTAIVCVWSSQGVANSNLSGWFDPPRAGDFVRNVRGHYRSIFKALLVCLGCLTYFNTSLQSEISFMSSDSKKFRRFSIPSTWLALFA